MCNSYLGKNGDKKTCKAPARTILEKKHIKSDIVKFRKDLSRLDDWFKEKWEKKTKKERRKN